MVGPQPSALLICANEIATEGEVIVMPSVTNTFGAEPVGEGVIVEPRCLQRFPGAIVTGQYINLAVCARIRQLSQVWLFGPVEYVGAGPVEILHSGGGIVTWPCWLTSASKELERLWQSSGWIEQGVAVG